MTDFWPKDLEISQNGRSPEAILQDAQRDFETKSQGLVELALHPSVSTRGNTYTQVYARHNPSGRTSTLFAVVHRPEKPYPVRLQPNDQDLPDGFRKKYTRYFDETFKIAASMRFGPEPETVENPWVATSPNEFQRLLRRIFNTEFVKSEIVNLAMHRSAPLGEEE